MVLQKSLPCVKGGAEQMRGGGIVFEPAKDYNPSVSLSADSSLYTREPFFFPSKSNIMKLYKIYLQTAKNVI